MKVCHVSTFDGGGAFIAALRYHEQMLKMNVESSFLIAPKSVHKNIKGLYYDSYAPSIAEKVVNRVNVIGRNKRKLSALRGDYEIFSFPDTVYRPEKNEHVQSADIVHLHFVSQFVNYPTFFKAIQKPIVWTLHDLNPIMGGFHYKIDYQRNKEKFGGVEEEITIRKRAFSETNKIHFVAPSRWMQDHLQRSVYSSYPHNIISNGIDLNEYHIKDKSGKSKSSKKKILFVAESFKNFRKGFDLLMDAIKNNTIASQAELMALGNVNSADVPPEVNIRLLGHITNEGQKASIYNEADIVVISSREDNLPNIMLEAMACGKPVIAFSNGGMSNVVDETNGILVKQVTESALREAILSFLNKDVVFDENVIRKYAETNFSIEKQTEKLIHLYESLL